MVQKVWCGVSWRALERACTHPRVFLFLVARGLVGTADGVPDAVDRSQLHGAVGPGGFGFCGRVRGGVVRSGPGNTQRTAIGWNDVRTAVFVLRIRQKATSHTNWHGECVLLLREGFTVPCCARGERVAAHRQQLPKEVAHAQPILPV